MLRQDSNRSSSIVHVPYVELLDYLAHDLAKCAITAVVFYFSRLTCQELVGLYEQ